MIAVEPGPQPAVMPEEERAAWRALREQGSEAAREALFFMHQGFARNIARRHFLDRKGGDIEFYDLCQLAFAGLLEVIDRYDPDRGVPFAAFASARVSGSIRDGVVKTSELREQIACQKRIRRERLRSLSKSETDTQSLGDAIKALSEIAGSLAIGFMLDGTGIYMAEDRDTGADAYEGLAWKQAARRLLEEVDRLPERERLIIRRHYFDGLSFETIAGVLGLSKGRISQLHRASMELLQKRLLSTVTKLGP
jgi:RNA polymerase sigma factor FliA